MTRYFGPRKTLVLLMVLLVATSNNLQAQMTTGTVDFDLNTLHSKNQVTVTLSDNTTLIINKTSLDDFDADVYTWSGKLVSEPDSTVVISVDTGTATGIIETENTSYAIRIGFSNINSVEENDSSTTIPLSESPIDSIIFRNDFELEGANRSKRALCTDSNTGKIDILVVYTQEASDYVNGKIDGKINEMVANANQVFENSKILWKYKLAGKTIIDNNDFPPLANLDANGWWDEIIRRLVTPNSPPNQNYFNSIKILRESVKADLVILIVGENESHPGHGGGAAITSNPQFPEPDKAFALVNINTTGEDPFNFSHELGHLMGGGHDRYQDPNREGYNFGFVRNIPFLRLRTIMAYGSECEDACPSRKIFSSATNTRYLLSLGDTNTDNSRIIREMAPIAACFRNSNQNSIVNSPALNDTGATLAGNYPNGNTSNCNSNINSPQDCHAGRDLTHNNDSDGHAGFSFTKLGVDGTELPSNATEWTCIRDNVTGLFWEVKTDDGSIHDKDNRYRWGGVTHQGSDYGTYYDDWDDLVNGSNSSNFCGFSDWRLPSANELTTIADKSRMNPAIDINYFPNTSSNEYWTSSPYSDNNHTARIVNFDYGTYYTTGRGVISRIRITR